MDRFSKRHGHSTTETDITIRDDAPTELRDFVIQLVYEFDYKPSFLRRIMCKILRTSPSPNNWTEYPNIETEVLQLIHACEWYSVYDIIEGFWNSIESKFRDSFTNELNDYFRRSGIGWKLENGKIETRGDETFEKSVTQVTTVLETANLQTANSEMKEALND